LGLWQSIDEAKSWIRVDDEKHAFGALANGNFVRGDMNTFGVVYRSTAGRGVAVRMPAEWADNIVSIRPSIVRKAHSPFVKIKGQILTLTPQGGNPLNIRVYDLKGRTVFNKTYNSAIILRSRDIVRSKGNYIVTVRNVAKETIYSGKMMFIR
jgi:hypothetical protein